MAVHPGDIGSLPIVTLTSLTISGPVSVNENDTALYSATATWSDSSTNVVTSGADWIEDSIYLISEKDMNLVGKNE